MVTDFITWVLSDFGMAMFYAAIILIIIHTLIRFKQLEFAEIAYRWIALLPLGFTGIYTFIMHVFYPGFSAAIIGWANSPFQYEVGMADLSLGVLGILSFKASYGFRLATVISAVIFFWGDAVGHLYQMFVNHNFAPGNAGSWFALDLVVPFILLLCIFQLQPKKRRVYV